MADPVVNLEGEIWKPIPGYEGRYEASSLGRIKCLRHVDARNHVRPEMIKRPQWGFGGYNIVTLFDGKTYRGLRLARLIATLFIGPPLDGMECCHHDGDRTNNAASNLRWDTRANNERDKVAHGTANRGEQHNCAKLSESDVRAIRQRRAAGESPYALASAYGVGYATVYNIAKGKTWKHMI